MAEGPQRTLMVAAGDELAEAVGMLGSVAMDVVVSATPTELDLAVLARPHQIVLVPGDDPDWLRAALTAAAPHVAPADATVRVVTATGRTPRRDWVGDALHGWEIAGVRIDRDVISIEVALVDPLAQPRPGVPADAVALVTDVVLGRGRRALDGPDDVAALAAARTRIYELEGELGEMRSAVDHSAPPSSDPGPAEGPVSRPASGTPLPGRPAKSGTAGRRRKLLLAATPVGLLAVALVVLASTEVLSATEALGIAGLGGVLVLLVDQRRRAMLIAGRIAQGNSLVSSAQRSIDRVGKAVGELAGVLARSSDKAAAGAEVTRVVLAGEARATAERLARLEATLQSIGEELSTARGDPAGTAGRAVDERVAG